jgi:hypothetical protein
MDSIRLLATVLLLIGVFSAACSEAPVLPDATPSLPSGSPSPSSPAESAGVAFDLSRLGYLDNILARASAGDWTLSDGTGATLRALIGASAMRGVLWNTNLASYDLTGLLSTARRQAAEDPDSVTRSRIASSLRFFDFDHGQLQGMVVRPGDPLPTALRFTPPPVLGPDETHIEDATFDPASRSYDTDCALFFRRFPIGPDTRACLDVRETEAAGASYSVYSPVPSLADFHWTASHHAWIDEAMRAAAPLYRDLGALPNLDIVLAPNMDAPAEGASFVNLDGCVVVLYTHLQLRGADAFKQILARQIAQCLFGTSLSSVGSVPFASERWLRDGLATYLSSLAFPTGEVELEAMAPLATIDDRSSIMDWSSAAYVWFEFADDRDPVDILETVGSLLPSPGGEGVLAQWPDFATEFAAFAQAYTDGAIRDARDQALTTTWQSSETDESEAEQPGTYAALDLPPFGFGRHLLVVDPAQLIRFAGSQHDGQVSIATRAYGAGDWTPLPEQFPPACLLDNRLLVLAVNSGSVQQATSLEISAVETAC